MRFGRIEQNPFMLFPETTPRRVVSLVPSMTESLFDLGFGETVVGVTDFCTRPPLPETLARVGGPKNARVEQILALQPDLVIANQEENSQMLIEALAAAGAPVWLTFPRTVRDALADLRDLAGLYRGDSALRKLDVLERSLEWAALAAADRPKTRVFVPIWEEGPLEEGGWWMTFNQETYPSDLLHMLGAENVFGQRARRYPLQADLGLAGPEPAGGRDTRYPRVTLAEVTAAQPELVLLPDEPYQYGANDAARVDSLLAGTPAAQNGRIKTVDGSLLFWPGTRLGMALFTLVDLLAS